MKLYFAPGACSLADHIALREAELTFDLVKVDLKAKRTENGEDFLKINPKGYVPALAFDDGAVLTENIAILSWIADHSDASAMAAGADSYRLLEILAFISTELHKSFKPMFSPGATDAEKQAAGETIVKRLGQLAERMQGDYLFGARASVADAYLFVMLRWAEQFGLAVPDPMQAFAARMKNRPAVRSALEHEGLS